MHQQLLFNFKTDISNIPIPPELNNPFGAYVPEIAEVAAIEFQDFIAEEAKEWKYDFSVQKGKMWGVLVVQKQDLSYGYLGTVSGKLPGNIQCAKFVPSVFDDSTDDFYINKGMTELTEIGKQMNNSDSPSEISLLKEIRRQKSIVLQQWLFEHYNFLNLSGKEKNLLDIFLHSSHGNPPAAAGECAAPKLLQYAIRHRLKPIALTEFWWGGYMKNTEREHRTFYPACKDRCRPILEYMLEDSELYNSQAEPKNEA